MRRERTGSTISTIYSGTHICRINIIRIIKFPSSISSRRDNHESSPEFARAREPYEPRLARDASRCYDGAANCPSRQFIFTLQKSRKDLQSVQKFRPLGKPLLCTFFPFPPLPDPSAHRPTRQSPFDRSVRRGGRANDHRRFRRLRVKRCFRKSETR